MAKTYPGDELATRAFFEEDPVEWCAHGPFMMKGLEDPVEIFEVGIPGFSPLRIPENSEKAKSAVAIGDEVTLGWRLRNAIMARGRT